MNVVPFVHEGLGNSSYLVGLSDATALLVDPDRSVQRYLEAAAARGWRIDAVFETHLHADFVSGAREIAAASGAKLFLPAGAQSRLPHHAVAAAERLTLDGVEVAAVASPGHTPEHLSYVVRTAGRPDALFSGGSLIVGGAARTDLIAPEMTEPLTRAQFHTLHDAFTSLPDATPLYPTHGGGSFCSAGDGGDRTSTLGAERAHNPVLAVDDEEEFVRWFPATFRAIPAYYARMRPLNQAGPRLRGEIAMPPHLPPHEFDLTRQEALVIDARPVGDYMRAHIPGALSIAFRDVFAVWLGWTAPPEPPLLFVAGDVPVDRIVEESLLVGYERFAGVLEGGMGAWEAAGLPIASARLVDAEAA
ncbi:MAG: MBL fold metallo-hydrolase, partial [Dehalococcoidia bacterium]